MIVLNKHKREAITAYLMLLPTLLGLFIFSLGATVGAILISLTDYSLKWPPEFIGLGNYVQLFSEKLFAKIISNTFLYVIITVVPCLILSFFLALAVNFKSKVITILRAAYFWPVVGSMAAIALVWSYLLNSQFGLLNYFISLFGVNGPNWLVDPSWSLVGIAIIFVWKFTGYFMTIILAGLQNIPNELYESAKLDGANLVQKNWYITLPMISSSLFFVMIMAAITAFQVFDIILIISPNGGPANANMTLSFYIYLNAFRYPYMGYASACAVLLFVIVMAVSVLQFRLQDKWVYYQ